MTQEEVIKSTLKYLYFKVDHIECGYEWREVCGLIMILEEHFGISYAEEYYSQFTTPMEGNKEAIVTNAEF